MTGWADTWMLSRYAKHPNCMLKWMAWMITPEVQAQVAEYFGEAPANPKACDILDKRLRLVLDPELLRRVSRHGPGFYDAISFWKTPIRGLRRQPRQRPASPMTSGSQAWTDVKGG